MTSSKICDIVIKLNCATKKRKIKMSEKISVGSDPELFVEHGDGSLFPAFEFLPDKYHGLPTGDGSTCYWDGYQAEFNCQPSISIVKMLDSVKLGLSAVLRAARKVDPTARLSNKTVVDVSREDLESRDPMHTEFGCMPSRNIYSIAGISEDGRKIFERWSGGHQHLGGISHDPVVVGNVVRALDAVVGVVGVSLFEQLDPPLRRRCYYGLAGEHRLPVYAGGKITGLEYRVLSSAWLSNPKLAYMIFDLARRAVEYSFSEHNEWRADEGEVIECILRNDVVMARNIIERNKHCFEKMGFHTDIDLMSAVHNSLPVDDIALNWGL